MFCWFAAGMLATATPQNRQFDLPDRFEYASPLPALEPVIIDKYSSGYGIAHQTARSKGLQGRIMWVDGTANLNRVNTRDKIIALVDRLTKIGFNTIVFDIKPIVGYTLYPSSFTDKLTYWRDGTLPEDFDPVPIFVEACKRQKVSFMVSMNAFSEGHRIAKQMENDPNSPFGKAGPGYARPQEQTVQYVAVPMLTLGQQQVEIEPTMNPTALPVGKIGIYTKWPAGNDYKVILDAKGVVQYKVSDGVPAGGHVIAGSGAAGDYLNQYALPGRKFTISTVPKFLIAAEVQNQIPLMMNPTLASVRQRGIEFATEVARKYDVDGILFDDRMRFGGVDADFSESTRAKFEASIGKPLNWPKDVFTFTYNWNLDRGVKPGPYWDRWWTWRAQQLQTWVIAVRKAIKMTRPSIQFGIYAGSWYGEYTKWGANYGRAGGRTAFTAVSEGYAKTGFADQLDLFIAGCYYEVPTIAEALSRATPEGRTVEAGAALANRVIHDQAWTYAGIMLQDFYDNPEDLPDALQSACASSQGVMVFDLSHNLDMFEATLTKAFKFKAKAPHQVPGLLDQVHKILAQREKLGIKDPPIFIQPGAPGTGH